MTWPIHEPSPDSFEMPGRLADSVKAVSAALAAGVSGAPDTLNEPAAPGNDANYAATTPGAASPA